MAVLATFASGYRRLYRDDEAELAACLGEAARARSGRLLTTDPANPTLNWWPSTLDFVAEARRHGETVGVASFQSLVDSVQRRRHACSAVYWFGHGAPSGELQFGQSSFGIQSIPMLRNANLSARLVTNGAITFFACNAAQNRIFLQALADALRVKVRGFDQGVRWALEFSGAAPHRRITRRGMHGHALPIPRHEFSPR